MKRLTIPQLVIPLLLLFTACSTQYKYAYVADAPRDEEMVISSEFSTTIAPGDQLYIYVLSQSPESVVHFNQETNKAVQNPQVTGYTVSQQGDIIFPVLGKIPAAGMTIEAFAHDIENRLISGLYVTDPVVTVRIMNFSVTVIGEVVRPSQIFVDGERITILEAIARCGDVTMDGIRSCVTVLRTVGNEVVADTVDLTSQSLFESPCYYLHQNDVVYVEPTPHKKRIAYRNEDWPRYLSTGVSAVQLAYTLVYRMIFTEWRNKN